MTVSPKKTTVPLTQMAYRTLRDMILNNELKVGTQYLEKTLVEKLSISRTPVREACIQLEKEGLIEIQPRHGIRVRPISPSDMREIYEILTALEAQAVARLATDGLNDEQLNLLDSATERMSKALEVDDLEQWAAADEDFHHALLDLSTNERLKKVVLQFWGQTHRVRFATLHLRDKPHGSTKDHAAVVQAIRDRDPEKARQLHTHHRTKGGQSMVSMLDRLRLENI